MLSKDKSAAFQFDSLIFFLLKCRRSRACFTSIGGNELCLALSLAWSGDSSDVESCRSSDYFLVEVFSMALCLFRPHFLGESG